MRVVKALTIAGSDSGGGAGIQADLKTFQELEVYGMSALTAVTAQNTRGVQGVYPLSVEAVAQQIDSIGEDLGADAVKTGMLFSSTIIEIVAQKVRDYQWDKLIVDPVMVAKGGSPLLQEEAVAAVKKHLIPLACVLTPNVPEASVLTGMPIHTLADREKAARALIDMGAKHVVMKGGHDESGEGIVDVLFDGHEFYYFESNRVATRHTHGTGCTFAAAVTAELAKGNHVVEAVKTAKEFIKAAIEDELGIGAGHGPTNHWAYQRRMQKELSR